MWPAVCNGKAKPVAPWSASSDIFHNALLRFYHFLCLQLYSMTNGVYWFKYNYSYLSQPRLSILNYIFDTRPFISLSVNFFCLPVPNIFTTLISLETISPLFQQISKTSQRILSRFPFVALKRPLVHWLLILSNPVTSHVRLSIFIFIFHV